MSLVLAGQTMVLLVLAGLWGLGDEHSLPEVEFRPWLWSEAGRQTHPYTTFKETEDWQFDIL